MLPNPLAALREPTSKGRGKREEEERGGRKGREEEGMGREKERTGRGGEGSLGDGRGRDPTPSRPLIHISGYAPDQYFFQQPNTKHFFRNSGVHRIRGR